MPGVARYDSKSGFLDETFAADAAYRHRASAPLPTPVAVAIQPDGKIVAVGFVAQQSGPPRHVNFAVARLHVDGSLDSTFDGDSRVVDRLQLGLDDAARTAQTAIAIQPNDGRIVVAGSSGPLGDSGFRRCPLPRLQLQRRQRRPSSAPMARKRSSPDRHAASTTSSSGSGATTTLDGGDGDDIALRRRRKRHPHRWLRERRL